MANTQGTCPITGEPATVIASSGDYREFDCPTCGHFRISNTALELAGGKKSLLEEALVAARSQATDGEVPTIDNISGG